MDSTQLEMPKNRKYVTCSFLNKMVQNKIAPALFLGSGFSKRYLKDYPDWLGLIKMLGERIGVDSFTITCLYDNEIKKGASHSEACLIATDFLETELNNKINSGKSKEIFSDSEMLEIETGHIEPLKYLAAQIFRKTFEINGDNYLKTELTYFSSLENIVPCVFTTNYDLFLESIFSHYKCFVSQNDYFHSDNTSYSEIYKIHGTATDPNSLVLTKKDYDEFNDKCYFSAAKLTEILSERPIIFIGYSLNDPNITNIINKISLCLSPKNLRKLQQNVVIIEHVKGKRTLTVGNKIYPLQNNPNGFRATYISTDNFIQLFWYLKQFQPSAKPSEIRKYKLMLKKLIETNDPKLKTIVTKYNETDRLPESVAVTGIGTSSVGYSKIPPEDLLLDALYERENFEPSKVIDEWLMQRVSRAILVPIYYYLKRFNLSKATSLTHDKKAIKEKLKSFHENKVSSFKKMFNKIDSVRSSLELDKLCQNHNIKTATKILTISKSMYIDGIIPPDDCRKRLQTLYENDNALLNTNEMKKAIVLLDFDEKIKI